MTTDRPKRILYPPVYFIFSIAFIAVIAFLTPLPVLFGGPLVWGFALSFVSTGVLIAILSAGLFKQAHTPVIPFRESTALVERGPYRYTRNPMYLGMAFCLIGLSVLTGKPINLIVVPIFVAVIHFRFVLPEEQFMTSLFGQAYKDYCQRVRRWL